MSGAGDSVGRQVIVDGHRPPQPATAGTEPKWSDKDLDTLKELSRKLGWAVTSSLGLKGEAKGKVYSWADGIARSLLARYLHGA